MNLSISYVTGAIFDPFERIAYLYTNQYQINPNSTQQTQSLGKVLKVNSFKRFLNENKKFDVNTFSELPNNVLIFSGNGEGNIATAALDSQGGQLYLGIFANPGIILQIGVRAFTLPTSPPLILNPVISFNTSDSILSASSRSENIFLGSHQSFCLLWNHSNFNGTSFPSKTFYQRFVMG